MSTIGIANGTIWQRSVVEHTGTTYFLARIQATGTPQLGIIGDTAGFVGAEVVGSATLFSCSPENAATLRERLAWLKPVALGMRTSFGFGDRMGTATPGHIQAMRATGADSSIAPIYAQQSVRENTRTGRTPQQVLDAAMWGVFKEGWQTAWGADADHVKKIADLAEFVAAGYTFYTIDPSDYVDNAAETDPVHVLQAKVVHLPWQQLDTSYEQMLQRYCSAPFVVDDLVIQFSEEQLLRALAKYGRAIIHTISIALALTTQLGGMPYDIEMSVDETDTPTSIHEHYLIANELLSRAIPLVSLAPRFIGKFQKGVDYIGDSELFASEFARHTAIRNHFNRYKLSIHTGSDKFSIYSIIAQLSHKSVHVKTAGTTYLEAVRLAALKAPTLFRAILDHALDHFEHDRKTYFLDAQLDKVPVSEVLSDADLPALLDQFDARQVLHVTFGSILDQYGPALYQLVELHEDVYRACLEQHFARHLKPFV
jgi:tagaturonate epimerase